MTNFINRPHELRVVVANNNSKASGDTYNAMTRVRKGDGITVEETVIQGTEQTIVEPEDE